MSSIDELEAPMLLIDKNFAEGDQLGGVSYDKTSHNTLGFHGRDDFTIFLPWKQWTKDLAYTDDAKEKKGDSALQEAFKDVLADGAKKDMCFIDFSHLWDGNELPFFKEGSKTATDQTKSVAKALADVIGDFTGDDKQIVIRFLVGDRLMNDPSKLQELVEDVFFPDGTPLVKKQKMRDSSKDDRPVQFLRSNAGKIPDIGKVISDKLHVDVDELDKIASYLEKLTGEEAMNILDSKAVSLSWNHGKILAVNGHSLMTGGANCAWESASNKYIIVEQSCKIRGDAAVSAHAWMDYFFNYLNKDHRGDTRSFAKVINLADGNKVWNNVHDVVEIGGTKTRPHAAPASLDPPHDIRARATEGVKILTCSQLADWHGGANDLDYPVQIVQLIKDLIMNVLWGALVKPNMKILDDSMKEVLPHLPVQAIAVTMIDAFFAEQPGPREQLAKFIGTEVPNPYEFLRINPNAWASRSTRLRAIANAKKEVILVQQRLVLPPTQEELKSTNSQQKAIVPTVNDALHLTAGHAWDGYMWPYDLLLAISYAILPTTRGGDLTSWIPDKDEGSANVFIVLSQFASNPNEAEGGWGDAMLIDDFERRLKLVIRGLVTLSNLPTVMKATSKPQLTPAQAEQMKAAAELFGKRFNVQLGLMEFSDEKDKLDKKSGDFFNEFDSYVDNKVHIRRVLKDHEEDHDSQWTGGKKDISCHCKLVCVDESLMYVGSDNAYPSYNEEHGVWHEDTTTIKPWKDKFWTTLWNDRAKSDTK